MSAILCYYGVLSMDRKLRKKKRVKMEEEMKPGMEILVFRFSVSLASHPNSFCHSDFAMRDSNAFSIVRLLALRLGLGVNPSKCEEIELCHLHSQIS